MNPSPHLLLVSLGPVQAFIASARRLQDLWFGSWILSELSKAAAKGMIEGTDQSNQGLIFPGSSPARLKAGSKENVANKILLQLPAGTDPCIIAERGRQAMQNRLTEISQAVLGKITGDFNRQRAQQQIDALMEFQWAALPIIGEFQSYDKARKELERLLSAVKNTKTWSQPPWASSDRKSSLDGERESVIPEEVFQKLKPEELYRLYRVRPNERLCGIGLLKRWGQDSESNSKVFANGVKPAFQSAGHIAAGHLRERLSKHPDIAAQVKDLWANIPVLKTQLARGGAPDPHLGQMDASLFFTQTDVLRRAFEVASSTALDADERRSSSRDLAQRVARKIDRLLEPLKIPSEPSPYYAVLLADGDKMGKLLDLRASKGQGEHQAMSQALSSFADEKVPAIVAGHQGCLVYAGGDDVLAMLPLHQALKCAEALRKQYAETMLKFKQGEIATTLSVGLAIVHFEEDLAEALEVARRAEKIAKNDAGRNALAIILSKRGGAEVACHGQWDGGLVNRLQALAQAHREGNIGSKLPYQLQELGKLLDTSLETQKDDKPTKDEKPHPNAALKDLVRSEALRLLGRRRQDGGAEKVAVSVADPIKARIEAIQSLKDLESLIGELRIAEELSHALRIAEGPLPAKQGHTHA